MCTKQKHMIISIMAVGIHMSPGGKHPMSHRVYALNSFVLPAHVGQCPYGNYST